MNQQSYFNLVAGKPGFVKSALRVLLYPLSLIYYLAVSTRNFLYDKRIKKIKKINVPIISVGNITVGGTGKTPLVIWLCKFLNKHNLKTAILTRGYKASDRSNQIDEPAVLAQSCPHTEVVINPNRIKGAITALKKYNTQVMVLDDGFQHRRLARDIDIITIDGTRPFGYGKMLPAGLLREPVKSIERAGAVVVTRCDQLDQAQLTRLEEKLQSINPDIVIARSVHRPVCIKLLSGEQLETSQLKNKKVFAFCGIGNPDAFFKTIDSLGAKIVDKQIFNDHHSYTEHEIENIVKKAQNNNAQMILSTQKDWDKISKSNYNHSNIQIPIGHLVVEFDFLSGQKQIEQFIDNALDIL